MREEKKEENPLMNESMLLRRRVNELEEALASHEQTKARYRRLLYEENVDGYAVVNVDGYFKDYNSAFMRMVGFSDKELRRMTYRDLTPPKWKVMEDEILRDEVFSCNSSRIYEKELIRKDGSVFPVELRTYPIRNQNSQPEGMWAFIRDITERKQSEQILCAQRDLCLALTGTASVQETLRLCLDIAVEVSGLDSGGIYIMNIRAKDLELSCYRNVSPEFAEFVRYIQAGSDKARIVMAGKPSYFEGPELDDLFRQEAFMKEGIKSSAVIPISSQERVIGCLNMSSHHSGKISPYARSVLESIASYIGLFVQRAQIEEAKRQSEKKYRDLLDFLPLSVFEFDREANVSAVNQAALETFGYTLEDVSKGFNALQVFIPVEKERAQKNIRKMLDGEFLDKQEYMVRRKNGSMFPAEILAVPVIQNDQTIGLRGVVVDITERKQTEEALRWKTTLLEAQLNTSIEGILVVDQHDRIILVNKRLIDLWNIPLNIVEGRDDAELLNYVLTLVQNPAEFLERVKDLYHHPYMISSDEIEFKNGMILDRYTAPVLDEKGHHYGRIWTFRDITKRKKAEEELINKHQQLSDIIEFLPDATLIVNQKKKIIAWNRAIEDMTGVRKEEIIGKDSSDAMIPFYGEPRLCLLDLIDAGNEELQSKYQYVRRKGYSLFAEAYTPALNDGTGAYIWATASVLRDSRGEVIAAIECIRDITERKKLEERLSHAEKMEGLGRLAGGVAHDLNNVLGILVGYSELLVEVVPDDNLIKKYAQNILESGMRGAAIIQDLLTLARRGVTVSNVVNLNQVIDDCLLTPEFEKLRFYHGDVKVHEELSKELMNIKGSPVHLGKTLMNLVSNAMESISGSGEVIIRTENRYMDMPVRGYDSIQEGDYAVLIVSDTGKGIPAEDLGKIFEPFYTKKVMGKSGTGLGLAVVWGTVKDHNGYIDVQSGVNQGSTFELYFPVTREEKRPEEKAIPKETYAGHQESILVVDDIPEQRELARSMLSRLGYQVAAVSGGEEALDWLRLNKADLIVLDMIMDPGIDGLETYERILSINPYQKAVIVSGFSLTDRVKEAQELGAGAYVRKPYILENLGSAIRKELDRSGSPNKGQEKLFKL